MGLSRRATELEQAIGLTALLAGELRYTHAPLEAVMARLAKQPGIPEFINFCAGLCVKGKCFPDAWQEALRCTPTAMAPDDLQPLFRLGAVLGAIDLDGALQEIEYARFALEQRHQEARERKRKMGGLYKTLGILAGLAVIVVLY